jgi:hypothetical protein
METLDSALVIGYPKGKTRRRKALATPSVLIEDGWKALAVDRLMIALANNHNGGTELDGT